MFQTDFKTLNTYLKVAIELAKDAGLMMLNTSGKNTQVDQKSSYADLVTETDKAIEAFTFEKIKKTWPTHKFIGEETTVSKINLTDDPTWIIDPIDGTMNYLHQLPYCCISIGLSVNKELVVGVVYSPFLQKLYTAIKGGGAFLNGQPIHTKPVKKLDEALIMAELGSDRSEMKKNLTMKNAIAFGWRCHGIRQMGSAALNICHIAEGCCDGYYEFGIHCWDMAAGVVILREAGGVVLDTIGGEFQLMNRRLVAAGTKELATIMTQTLVAHLTLESD